MHQRHKRVYVYEEIHGRLVHEWLPKLDGEGGLGEQEGPGQEGGAAEGVEALLGHAGDLGAEGEEDEL